MRVELPVVVSQHFAKRAAQRGLSSDVLSFVMTYGTEFPATGAMSLTVLERDLPRGLRGSPLARESKGWVIVQKLGVLFTCYRRQGASRFLRRKQKRPRWARPCAAGRCEVDPDGVETNAELSARPRSVGRKLESTLHRPRTEPHDDHLDPCTR